MADDIGRENICTFEQIVHNIPYIAKVCDSIYDSNETQSFSNGDTIWFKEKKVFTEISAQAVDVSANNTWYVVSSRRLIPLGIGIPVKVVMPHRSLQSTKSISDLIDICHRFVRVDKYFTSPCGVFFVEGSHFETVRILPQKGTKSLVVVYKEREVALPGTLSGCFTPMEENNVYLLKRVLEKYSLPLYVKFLGDEMESGMTSSKHCIFWLSRFVQTTAVIGHINSSCQSVIFPLSNTGVLAGVTFYLPYCSETEEYKRIVQQNFSGCEESVEPETVESMSQGMYIDNKNKHPRTLYELGENNQTGENTLLRTPQHLEGKA